MQQLQLLLKMLANSRSMVQASTASKQHAHRERQLLSVHKSIYSSQKQQHHSSPWMMWFKRMLVVIGSKVVLTKSDRLLTSGMLRALKACSTAAGQVGSKALMVIWSMCE
jgi:hypothetical protein